MQYFTPLLNPPTFHTHAQIEFQTLLFTYIDEGPSDKKRNLRLAHCIKLLKICGTHMCGE